MKTIKLQILILCIFTHATSIVLAQIQKGDDLDGEAAGDRFGRSVSMPDVNTVAIGAYQNDGSGTDAGHVRIFHWNGSGWTQKGIDINGISAGDNFGSSVSMPDSNTIAIGANGHVDIYYWNDTAWMQKGADISGVAADAYTGIAVSMPDTNTVAIGAYLNDNSGTDAGHVRIYSWNGNTWIQKGNDINGEAAGDESGRSVSMPDSNTVAIGAIKNDGNGLSSGHVRIFSWSGSAWTQKGTDINGEASGDGSGRSVSMADSNTVAIGAYYNDGSGTEAGHVRIYRWNGSGWSQKGNDIDGETAGDWSGWSVSMPDTNTVAIGAHKNYGNGNEAGHVRIYSWNGSAWTQKGTDIDGESAVDWSGYSVSMPDNNTVAIGAPYNDGNGAYAGHIRVFFSLCNTSSLISTSACDSYTLNSQTYTTSGTYTQTLTNSAGCDSTITLNLTIKQSTSSTLNETACDSYTLNSQSYTSSGTYTQTLTNAAGCDSTITLTLTINQLPSTPTISANETTLSSSSTTGNQWYLNGNIITGATSQNYTVIQNGNYTVVVTDSNGCSSTSLPYNFNSIGIYELSLDNSFFIIPNPNKGRFQLQVKRALTGTIKISNSVGEIIYESAISNRDIDLSKHPKGIYSIEINSPERTFYKKMIIQ